MLYHGCVTCCVSTWLHADRAALARRGEGEMTVYFGTGALITNHPPSGTQTSHTGLWGPDGLVKHGQTLVHTLALLTWNNTETVMSGVINWNQTMKCLYYLEALVHFTLANNVWDTLRPGSVPIRTHTMGKNMTATVVYWRLTSAVSTHSHKTLYETSAASPSWVHGKISGFLHNNCADAESIISIETTGHNYKACKQSLNTIKQAVGDTLLHSGKWEEAPNVVSFHSDTKHFHCESCLNNRNTLDHGVLLRDYTILLHIERVSQPLPCCSFVC